MRKLKGEPVFLHNLCYGKNAGGTFAVSLTVSVRNSRRVFGPVPVFPDLCHGETPELEGEQTPPPSAGHVVRRAFGVVREQTQRHNSQRLN